jgi:hypothetical protein
MKPTTSVYNMLQTNKNWRAFSGAGQPATKPLHQAGQQVA